MVKPLEEEVLEGRKFRGKTELEEDEVTRAEGLLSKGFLLE